MRNWLRISLTIFFVSPILIWLVQIERWSQPDWDWIWPLATAVTQAGLSAAGAIILGFIMATGAAVLPRGRSERWLEYWLLIPNLIPSIFLILAVLNLSVWLPFLRVGLGAVIVTHILLNSGLVALALLRLIRSRLTGFVDAALIAGASRPMVWLEIILPALKREILFLFLFVFSVCLTSFSIPLILGGVHAANFEILIYQTLRTSSAWDHAIYYALIQMLILFLFACIVPKPQWSLAESAEAYSPIGIRHHLPLAFIPSGLILTGWSLGIFRALDHFSLDEIPTAIWFTAVNTIAIALGVGLLTLILCLLIAYVTPHSRFSWFMKGFLAPSSAITGFAFLLLPGDGGGWAIFKIAVALTLVLFPLLFRWIGQAALESLEEQVYIARTLGASWWKIVSDVIWPQRADVFLRMAGLGALWASGDFAVSSIIAEGNQTLALSVSGFMASYRLDLASLMTVPLFILGLVCYGLFVGAGRYVTR